MAVTKTYSILPPRSDFDRNEFDKLIYQKGRRVIYEKALLCPCKSEVLNQQSNCKNCGGSGWIFYNPTDTRMIIAGVSVTTDYKAWSEESGGMINISANFDEQLTIMDRITLVDANAISTEVVHIKKVNNILFGFLCYKPKKILYLGQYISVNDPLLRLDNSNVTFDNNIIRLNSSFLEPGEQNITLTLRYVHAPAYHVVEMKRETIESFKYNAGGEQLLNLPVSAIGRRAHLELNAKNLTGDNIISNSYQEDKDCSLSGTCCYNSSQTIIIPPTPNPPHPPTDNDYIEIPFINQTSITITHLLNRHIDCIIFNTFGNEIEGEVTTIDLNTIKVAFNISQSGTIIIR